jgi:hypothetical protein
MSHAVRTRLGAVLVAAHLALTGCTSGMILEVQIEHRLRCLLLKRPGGWPFGQGAQRDQDSTPVALEECKQALERILAQWETFRQ